jgi:hypothetical protein
MSNLFFSLSGVKPGLFKNLFACKNTSYKIVARQGRLQGGHCASRIWSTGQFCIYTICSKYIHILNTYIIYMKI